MTRLNIIEPSRLHPDKSPKKHANNQVAHASLTTQKISDYEFTSELKKTQEALRNSEKSGVLERQKSAVINELDSLPISINTEDKVANAQKIPTL